MKIAVFCSANDNIDQDFFKIAEELGQWMAENGHQLIYGGANCGLMERIGKVVCENNGRTIGFIPAILEQKKKKSQYVNVEIPCNNLSDRKELMISQCDIAIALPGGIGTIDEIFTLIASNLMGYHDKSIILFNAKGFWNSLIKMLDALSGQNMIRGDWHNTVLVANNLKELKTLIAETK